MQGLLARLDGPVARGEEGRRGFAKARQGRHPHRIAEAREAHRGILWGCRACAPRRRAPRHSPAAPERQPAGGDARGGGAERSPLARGERFGRRELAGLFVSGIDAHGIGLGGAILRPPIPAASILSLLPGPSSTTTAALGSGAPRRVPGDVAGPDARLATARVVSSEYCGSHGSSAFGKQCPSGRSGCHARWLLLASQMRHQTYMRAKKAPISLENRGWM